MSDFDHFLYRQHLIRVLADAFVELDADVDESDMSADDAIARIRQISDEAFSDVSIDEVDSLLLIAGDSV